MHIVQKLFITFAAVIVAMASGVTVANADSAATVYNTPGGQSVNGRLWNTTCEKYSSNVVRCRTNIWATQVHLVKGNYVQKTGWTFNNLSYLASPRTSWAGNNLGRTNNSWASGGKTWRTECDTATTGRGGCRSYVWTKQAQAKKVGSTWSYSNVEGWVFNNLVLFAEGSVKPVTAIPAHILDQSYLDFTGIGAIRVESRFDALEKLGYARWVSGDCSYWAETTTLNNRGIQYLYQSYERDDVVMGVSATTAGVRTAKGATVGMTVGQMQSLYGNSFKVLNKGNSMGNAYVGSVRSGQYELQFRAVGSQSDYWAERPLKPSDTVVEILAQRYDPDVLLIWGGC